MCIMKIRILLMISFIIGLISCKDEESSGFDILTDGTWTLETTSPVFEYLDFKANMTYKITGLMSSSPRINNGVAIETGFVTGEWNLEGNKITFLTAHAELNTNNLDIDIPTVDSQPLCSFYGYQVVGIFQDTSDIGGIINIRGDTTSLDSEYSPTVWIIEGLTEKSLIVKSGIETIKYNKQ